MDEFKLLVDSSEPQAGWITVNNPYDLTPVCRVATGDSRHVDSALNSASSCFENREQWLPVDERIAIFGRAIHQVSKRKEELALTIASEGGKPLVDARVEVDRAIDGLKLCIDCLRGETGSLPAIDATVTGRDHMVFTHHEPIGVVVAVSAFNHPLNLIVHQIGPAIAAGCPVIVKPSEDTPVSCLKLADMFHQAGLPLSWLQVLITDSIPVAEHLVTSERVAFFSFIGSARVGWLLRSKLAQGVRCALEHGGVAPAIVAESADLDFAVSRLLKGAFYHAGQVCVSTQRIFVHKSQSQAFIKKFSLEAKQLKVGNPTEDTTEVGPLIRLAEIDRVEEWVNEARQNGATVTCGGQKVGQTCYMPTVIVEPSVSDRVSQQEVFGPVVCIYEYDDINTAIKQANDLPFAFQAAVFSNNHQEILLAYKKLNASAIMVNEHTAFRTDSMPFAGLKTSGLGVGGIPHTFKDMQIEKMMVMHSPHG
ncbi:aldehyde dehydrogenase [Endozoicomonas sp. OPT23]|uniref:aldehyde dehydrogenase family protein n=1 Tax=Endozoicomonas sp. OPT23 TaxID=2072845 RepID=UPI00129B9283|nr:aldehyde dehydrogenase family protein [Endozoicomonas sp. OPT23]MRI31856.1 aldehyde dehydrogenase [Endozoicomonas sp. OPT23]